MLRITDRRGLVHAVDGAFTRCGRPISPLAKCWEPQKGDVYEICIICKKRELEHLEEGESA